MIDAMFQAGTDAALNDQVRRPAAPKPPAAPGFSFMDLVESPFQGVGGAAANSIAFGAEITGAFGDVLGATGTAGAGGMLGGQTDKERADAEAARRKLMAQGPGFSNEAGDTFRRRAADIMPDPNTTHTSAQVVAGLAQFFAQAIGYGLTLGPAAPLALAGDVGLTESDRLKQQGVDLATRTKAGAVAGAVAGVSVVVPMTGATAVTRALKGVAVGEGSMVGQSAAERAILKAGGYDKIADSFDPLDPVALGMGLVPGALGAKFGGPRAKPGAEPPRSLAAMGLTERQALPYNDVKLDAYAVQAAQREGIPPEVLLAVKNAGEKSAPTATSPAGAQGVMQFMPGTWKEFGRGDPADPVNSIDAGARYLRKLHDAYGNWDAALAHYNGGGAQAAIVRGGGVPTAPETAAYLKRVNAYLGKTVDEHVAAAVDAQPDLVPAARVGQAAAALEASRLTAADDLPGRDAHVRAVETAADQLGRGEPVRVDEIVGPHIAAQDEHMAWMSDSKVRSADGSPLTVFHGTKEEFSQFDTMAGSTPGSWFTTAREGAEQFGSVKEVNLSIKNPGSVADLAAARIQAAKDGFDAMEAPRAFNEAVIKNLEAKGFDGIHQTNFKGAGGGEVWAALRPEQIRPARAMRDAPRPAEVAVALDELHAARQPAEPPARNAPPTTQAPNPEAATPARSAGEPAPAGRVPEPGATATTEAAGVERAPQAMLDRAAAEVSMLSPDLLVQLDGMDAPVKVGELLERVKREAAEDAADARLVEVAAACALRA